MSGPIKIHFDATIFKRVNISFRFTMQRAAVENVPKMVPRLCLVILLICVPEGLQAVPSSIAPETVQTDNLIAETPSQIHCKKYSKLEFSECKNASKTTLPALGEMPHMVMIASEYLPFRGGKMDRVCGGVLISQNYVLTSGTCGYIVEMINEEGESFVRLGEVKKDFSVETSSDSLNGTESDFPNDTIPGDPTQIIKIAQVILHPKFSRDEEDGPHNLALLRLTIPAKFTAFVRPACLEKSGKFGDVPLIVTDWNRGDTHYHALRKSISKAISYEECKLISRPPKHDMNTQICADRVGDILCGDDGANVLQTLLTGASCSYRIIGISGVVRCWATKGPQRLPFIKLAHYVPWIESVVWP